MKITHKSEVPFIEKPEGTSVSYYLFPEYEIHVDVQAPHTTQTWHKHEKIWETLYIVEGELTALWKEDEIISKQTVSTGDVIETEHGMHTFANDTEIPTKYIVIKQVLSGENKRELLKTDKVVAENQ